jgi:AraC family transcriptional regulator, transcriptional activator of pobA
MKLKAGGIKTESNMKRTAKIPVHTKEFDGLGVRLKAFAELRETIKTAHRDDHYMFILQQKGEFLFEIDFGEIKLKGAAICFVGPGQVHRYLKRKDNEGWFVFVDVSLVTEQYREIFDAYQHVRQTVAVEAGDVLFKSMLIFQQLLSSEPGVLNRSVISFQLSAIVGMIALKIMQPKTSGNSINGQRYLLSNHFKQLVKQDYKDVKQVQQYAERLNITPLYLNEVVREITGFPASYWIQQEIILEAKRLLYYTVLDVKQIAYELGYEDHAYFSRFFKKNTGMTALEFRIKNHDMSNHRP